jgi:pimeloyl-ACP methyl ester carboxylesterase
MTDIYTSDAGRLQIEAMYRRALDRWPVPREERMITTREGNTFAVVSGDPAAPPLVLLHGSGANSGAWLGDVAAWSRQFRVHAVDVIGEPGFSAPARPALGSGAYAAWLDDVWTGLGIARAGIVGTSLGGWLALDFAIRRPQRVTSLSLISPAGIGRQKVSTMLRLAMLRLRGERGLVRSLQLVSGPREPLPAPLQQAILTVFRNYRPRRQRIPLRTDGELAGLSMPVQAIVGSDDAMIRSNETRDRLQRHVRQVECAYLEGQGHILPPQTAAVAAFAGEACARA